MPNSLSNDARFSFADSDGGSIVAVPPEIAETAQPPEHDRAQLPPPRVGTTWKSKLNNLFRPRPNTAPQADDVAPPRDEGNNNIAPDNRRDQERGRSGIRDFFSSGTGTSIKEKIKAPFKKLKTNAKNAGFHIRTRRKAADAFGFLSHMRQETVAAKGPATKPLSEMNLPKAPADAECELRQPISGPGKFDEVKELITGFPKTVARQIKSSVKQLSGSANRDQEITPLDEENFTASFDRFFPRPQAAAQVAPPNQTREELKQQLQALPEATDMDLTTLAFALAATSGDNAENALRALTYLRDTDLVSAVETAHKEFVSPAENRPANSSPFQEPRRLRSDYPPVPEKGPSLLDELLEEVGKSNDEVHRFFSKAKPESTGNLGNREPSEPQASALAREGRKIPSGLEDIKGEVEKWPDDVYEFLLDDKETQASGLTATTTTADNTAADHTSVEVKRIAWRTAQVLAASPIGRSALRAVAKARPEHHEYDNYEVVFTDFLKLGGRIIGYDGRQSPLPADLLRSDSESVPALLRDGLRAMAHRLAEKDDITKLTREEKICYRYARNKGLERHMDRVQAMAASFDKWVERDAMELSLKDMFHKLPLSAPDENTKRAMEQARTGAVPTIMPQIRGQMLVRDALKMVNDQRLAAADAKLMPQPGLPISDEHKTTTIRDVVREAILTEVWCKKTPIEMGAAHQFTQQDLVNITAFVGKRFGNAKNALSAISPEDIEAAVNDYCGKEKIWVDRIPTTDSKFLQRQVISIPKQQANHKTLETWWDETQEAWAKFGPKAEDIALLGAANDPDGAQEARQSLAKFEAMGAGFRVALEGMKGKLSLHQFEAKLEAQKNQLDPKLEAEEIRTAAIDWSKQKAKTKDEVSEVLKTNGKIMNEVVRATLISGGGSFGDRRPNGVSTNHPAVQIAAQVAAVVPLPAYVQFTIGDEGVFSWGLNGAYAEIRIDKYKASVGGKLALTPQVGLLYKNQGLALGLEFSAAYDIKNVESLSFRFTRNAIPPRGVIRDEDGNPVTDEKGAVQWAHDGQKGGLSNDHRLMKEVGDFVEAMYVTELTDEEKASGMTYLDKLILAAPDHMSINYTPGGWTRSGNKNHLFTATAGAKAIARLPDAVSGLGPAAVGSLQWRLGQTERQDVAGAMPADNHTKKNQLVGSGGAQLGLARKNVNLPPSFTTGLLASLQTAGAEYSVDFLNRGHDNKRLLAFQEGELADGSSAAEIYWNFSELEKAVRKRLPEFVGRLVEGPRADLEAKRAAEHWAAVEERYWVEQEEQWSNQWDASNPPTNPPDGRREAAKEKAKQEAKATALAEFRERNSEEIRNFRVELDPAEVQELFDERLEMLRRSLTQMQTARTATDSFTLFTKLKPENYKSYNFHKTIEGIAKATAPSDANARRELDIVGEQSRRVIKKMKLKDPSNNEPWDVLFVLMSRQYEASTRNTFNLILTAAKQRIVTGSHLALAVATSTPKPL